MWNIFLRILLIHTIILVPLIQCYDIPTNPQYHIQTDEGPERYFRYQTLSGQYRKEKRLEDGTVIGTYAWIDDDGMLRQRDYIADKAGYRILKSKNLFVGRNIPVGDAVKLAKKYQATAGVLVSSKPRTTIHTSTIAPPITTAAPVYSSTAIPCASCSTGAPTTPSPNIFYSTTHQPHVEIINNALPSSTSFPFISTTEKPFVAITSSGVTSDVFGGSTTGAPPSTALPLDYLKADINAINNMQYDHPSSSSIKQVPAGVQYAASPYDSLPTYTESDQNSLDINPYVSQLNQGYFFHNGPTYPIDRNGHTYRGNKRYTNPNIENNKRFSQYDGVSVTNDGFRYYIPRAYHEEQTDQSNQERSGSFGYIDPFGIRRVIYYNTKPGEGFQHRKNNRYVGFDATPYDPRPAY